MVSPLDLATGHLGQGIKMIKLIFGDFYVCDVKNLDTCSLYTCLCCVKILATFLKRHLRYEGGGAIDPPPPDDFKNIQTSPVIGLNYLPVLTTNAARTSKDNIIKVVCFLSEKIKEIFRNLPKNVNLPKMVKKNL